MYPDKFKPALSTASNTILQGSGHLLNLQCKCHNDQQCGCDQEFMSKRKVVVTITYHDLLKKLKNAIDYQRVHTAHCCAEQERLIKAKYQRICLALFCHVFLGFITGSLRAVSLVLWCQDGGGNGLTKTSLITHLHDRYCCDEAQAITKHSLLTDLAVFKWAELTFKRMGLWLCGVCFKTHNLSSTCRHGNGSNFVSPIDSGDGALDKVIYKPDDISCWVSLLVLTLCILKTFRPRSNLECMSIIKRQHQEESIVNAIQSWGTPGGSLQLLRETLAESSSTYLDVDDDNLDLGERNIKQCMRKICDGHYTVVTKHPFYPTPSLPHIPTDHHHLIASSTMVLDRIKSFTRGTSCGRDGLRAQHLDCLSGAIVAAFMSCSPLSPKWVSAIMIGHSLDGYLDGLYFGIGVSGGSKAILHSVNRLIEAYGDDIGLLMLLVDFKNALNLVDREGDPHGLLFFALVLHPLICKIRGSFSLSLLAWYLDDGTIIKDTLVVRNVLELIIEEGPRLYFTMCTCPPRVIESAQCSFDVALRSSLEHIVTSSGPSDDLQTKLLWHTGIVSLGPIFDDALSVFNTSMKTDLLSNPTGKVVNIGLDRGHDKPFRPADMLLYSWDSGLDVCGDLTGSSPLIQTEMVDFVPGRAVIDAAQRKREVFVNEPIVTEPTVKKHAVETSEAKASADKPNVANTVNREVQLQALVDGKKVIKTESTIRRDLQLEDAKGVGCLPNAAIFEQLTLIGAATTATSLDAEQDRGNIFKTQSKPTPNEPGSQGTSFSGANTHRSGEDSLKHNELMELCTKLQQRVIDLETTKNTQALEIDSLKRRVKKLEKRKRSRAYGLKILYKVGMLARVESSEDEVTTAATTPTILIDEVTLAQALIELKHKNPKAKSKGIIFHEPEESAKTTTAAIPKPRLQDKGKAKMIEEPMKLKNKDQIQLNEEVALKLQAELQAEFKKEQRLASEKAQQEKETNIELIESWDDVQAKIDADYQLAERLQAEEQQELNDEEKATLFMQLLEKRRKFFVAKRAEEKQNKPPTQAQQRKIIAYKRKNTFVDYKTALVEESFKKAEAEVTKGSSKRAREELDQENAKRQKIDDDKDTAELKQ
uniref:Putative reverse transcriptase domain-containing protein n=1 Tax=Tanacetum cinerariifolium TaxID=118510 RepID=A0A6L2K8T0_TANCI|nr:putative reverse transcriptase domain-containing protein [Tanacetum cinerariifolium]